jgi:UDPglucose--hexose-1-phosphate uridylyltransferase
MLDATSDDIPSSKIQYPASHIDRLMPELRTDWLTGRSVLIAENRANRPNEFDAYSPSATSIDGEAASAAVRSGRAFACPFCPGNEAETPPALFEHLDPENRWSIRVIPNKYPAVTETAGSAFGVHEVIIETARHIDRTSLLSESELRQVFGTYAARLRHWRDDGRLAFGLLFKNQGPRAGASLAHLHSQFIALPAVPAAVDAELRRAKDWQSEHGSCAYCHWIHQEREAGVRVVGDSDGYIAFCPFVSLQPCEVWLLPATHEPAFEWATTDDSLSRLAKVCRLVVVAIESLVPASSFNMLLRTAPWSGACETCFHWRIELQPRVNAIAGLESATGIYVNPVAPERAAAELRLAIRTL